MFYSVIRRRAVEVARQITRGAETALPLAMVGNRIDFK